MLFENDCPSLMLKQTVAVRLCMVNNFRVSSDCGNVGERGHV